jgi:hypothetical protein
VTKDAKPDTWMPRFPRVKRGSSLRLELHLSTFYSLTMSLTAAAEGHLMLMLVAEAAQEGIPPAPNESVQRAFDRRDEYRRIKGGFGRVSLSLAKRRAVFERDGRACRYCGRQLEWSTYHCDHVEPVSKGGSDSLANLAASCIPCNLSKKDRTLAQWMGR